MKIKLQIKIKSVSVLSFHFAGSENYRKCWDKNLLLMQSTPTSPDITIILGNIIDEHNSNNKLNSLVINCDILPETLSRLYTII